MEWGRKGSVLLFLLSFCCSIRTLGNPRLMKKSKHANALGLWLYQTHKILNTYFPIFGAVKPRENELNCLQNKTSEVGAGILPKFLFTKSKL
jgi:hypothetical protein